MVSPHSRLWQLLDHLAGWLLLVCGMIMLNGSVLVPAWISAAKLANQRNVLEAQVRYLAEQEEAYRRFHQALVQRDPVLLQRLAYLHLGLKPVGAKLLQASARLPSSDTFSRSMAQEAWDSTFAPADIGVGAWLDQPIPEPDAETIVPKASSRLASVVQGPARVTLVASGLVCLVMGLIMPINAPWSRRNSS